MGLISQEVELVLHNKMISYYENLGYYIPKYENKKKHKMCVRRGTKIKVKVKDLSFGSNAIVQVTCDCCKKDLFMTYTRYLNNLHNGKIYCANCVHKMLHTGINNPAWNPNRTEEERENGRNLPEYDIFLRKVMARDKGVCQICGEKASDVHHLDGYNWCIEKRTDTSNGISLCERCHSSFHSIYGYGNNTKQQFEEYCNKIVELLEDNVEIEPSRLIHCIEDNINETYKYYINNGVHQSHLYECCNKQVRSVKGKHYLWYDEYINMSEDDLNTYLEWANYSQEKKVICITTMEVFNSIKEAVLKYGVGAGGDISRCCKGKRKYCGSLSDGTKLQWMYYEDYVKQKTD